MNLSDFKDIAPVAAIMNVAIIAAGTIVTYLMSRRKSLEQRGYPETYIDFQQKFNKNSGISIIAFLVIVQVLFAVIASFFIEQLKPRDYMDFIIIPTMILILPFALMKTIKQNREYKRLADENNLEIAVDFGFIKLKQMFNIRIEIISSLLVFSYLLMHAELRRSLMIVLYVLLLWFFFAGLRFSKYSIKPVLKDQYMRFGKMLLLYQAMLAFLLFIPYGLDNWSGSGSAGRLMFIIVAAGLIAKLIFYWTRFPGFKKEIGETA